jgi:bifunctional enzyme CysN/CysC
MSHQSSLIETDILTYLNQQEHKSLLRFITCGSVDDGKSTLIGRLLYESKLIYEDQLAALEKDSKKLGTQGDAMDFALLVDGLASEREQGITIDVAYRFFSTDKRKFIVADTPGHEQYTRNMATGASTADLAILMVDARHGILTQTRRHSTIVQLLGVKQIVLAINKMDLVDYSQSRFNDICSEYRAFAKDIGLSQITAIPMSALNGDNITSKSDNFPWYKGPCLLTFLETVPVTSVHTTDSFSMPVQWVNRPHLDFRGFCGQITTGSVSVGDEIMVLPAKVKSRVKSIVTFENTLPRAIRGESVTITLADEIDVSRGDVLVSTDSPVDYTRQCSCTILWMSENALELNKPYWIKTRAKLFSGVLSGLHFKLNVNTLQKTDATSLTLNEIGQATCEFDQDIAFEPYKKNPHLGSFIMIDRATNHTVGMGLIESKIQDDNWVKPHVNHRNKYWVRGFITSKDRETKNRHRPLLLLLSGSVNRQQFIESGTALELALFNAGVQVYRYGAQFLRSINDEDISELRSNMIRQILDIAFSFMDAGMVFITSVRCLTPSELIDIESLAHPFEVMVVNLGGSSDVSKLTWTENQPKAILDPILQAIHYN